MYVHIYPNLHTYLHTCICIHTYTCNDSHIQVIIGDFAGRLPDSKAKFVISVSIAATMKLKTENVNISSMSLLPMLSSLKTSITVVYSVVIPNTVYPLSYYLNALTTAVQSGSFSTVLQRNALQYNSTALLDATSSSITIIGTSIHLHAHKHVWSAIHLSLHTYIIHTYIYSYIYTYIHIYMYTHTYMYAYT